MVKTRQTCLPTGRNRLLAVFTAVAMTLLMPTSWLPSMTVSALEDDTVYYISGFNASIFHTRDGSVPQYDYQKYQMGYSTSSYTHDLTANDIVDETIGYCVERLDNHTVATQGLTRRLLSEAVNGQVAGSYVTESQANTIIRLLKHRTEVLSYGAQTFGSYFPGRSMSELLPGMDAMICKDYPMQHLI